MSIRLKVLGSLILGFVICAAGFFGTMHIFVWPVLKAFMVEDAIEDLTRVTNSFEREIETLDQLAHDWASWNELYAFMDSGDKTFVDSNLHVTTFLNNHLSLVAVLDKNQRPVWSYLFDKAANRLEPFDLQRAANLASDHPIFRMDAKRVGAQGGVKGIILVGEREFLVSSRPILTTDEGGPARGILLFGREMDEEFNRRMAKLCMVDFAIRRETEQAPLSGWEEAIEEKGVLYRYDLSPADFVRIERAYSDLDGRPSLRIKARIQKFDIARGGSPLTFPILMGFLAFAVVASLTIFVLSRTVLGPLRILTRHADRINESGDFTLRLESRRDDELGRLAHTFDRLMAHIEKNTSELTAANAELERLSYLDGLTRISNRRLFDGRLETEWKRLTRRDESSLALIMIDIDFFKSYNDRYGHLAGDDCLRQVSAAIAQQVKRTSDVVARYGGEEFGLLLPATNIAGARELAERIRLAVENLHLKAAREDVSVYVTISLGVTVAKTHEERLDQTALIARADAALYESKHNGRNRSTFLPFLPQAQKLDEPLVAPREPEGRT